MPAIVRPTLPTWCITSSSSTLNGERPTTRHIPWIAAVLFLLSSQCYPQDITPTDPEAIRRLVQQLKDLQERVRVLESQQNHADASTPNSSNPPTPRVEPTDRTESDRSVAEELHEVRGIQWRGFGEVDYKVLNQ